MWPAQASTVKTWEKPEPCSIASDLGNSKCGNWELKREKVVTPLWLGAFAFSFIGDLLLLVPGVVFLRAFRLFFSVAPIPSTDPTHTRKQAGRLSACRIMWPPLYTRLHVMFSVAWWVNFSEASYKRGKKTDDMTASRWSKIDPENLVDWLDQMATIRHGGNMHVLLLNWTGSLPSPFIMWSSCVGRVIGWICKNVHWSTMTMECRGSLCPHEPWRKTMCLLLPPFQIVDRFDFYRFIDIITRIDIYYI